MMTLRSERSAWPTNLCVADIAVAEALLEIPANSVLSSEHRDLLLDPWGSPYHMTLQILPPNPHVEANLRVWSFGPNKRNNQSKKDDMVIRITAPNKMPRHVP